MKEIYHTPIKIQTICKNGSERYGAVAECFFWFGKEGETKIEVSIYGETIKRAEEKMMRFLTYSGKYKSTSSLNNIAIKP